MQSSAISASSSRVKTFPVGLCGEFSTIARTPANAVRSSSGSNDQSGGRSVTNRRSAPVRIESGPYAS